MKYSLLALILAYYAMLTLQQQQKRHKLHQQMGSRWMKYVNHPKKHDGHLETLEAQQDIVDIKTNKHHSRKGGGQKRKFPFTEIGKNRLNGSMISINRKLSSSNIPASKVYSLDRPNHRQLKLYSSMNSRRKNTSGRSSSNLHSKERHLMHGLGDLYTSSAYTTNGGRDYDIQTSPSSILPSLSLSQQAPSLGTSTSKTTSNNKKSSSRHSGVQHSVPPVFSTRARLPNDQPVPNVKRNPRRSRPKRRSNARKRKAQKNSKRHRKRHSGDEFGQGYSQKENGREDKGDVQSAEGKRGPVFSSKGNDRREVVENAHENNLVDNKDEEASGSATKDSKPDVDPMKASGSATKADKEPTTSGTHDEASSSVDDRDGNAVRVDNIVTPPPAFGLFATVQELVLTVKALYKQQEQDRHRLMILERRFRSQNNDLQLQQSKVTHLTENLQNVDSSLSNLDTVTKQIKREVAQVRTKSHRLGRAIGDNRRYRRRLSDRVDAITEQLTQDIESIHTKHTTDLDTVFTNIEGIKVNMKNVNEDMKNVKSILQEFDGKESVNSGRVRILEEEQDEALLRMTDIERNVTKVRDELKEIREEHRVLITDLEDMEDALVVSSDPEYHDEFQEQQRESGTQADGFDKSVDNSRIRKSRHLSRIIASLTAINESNRQKSVSDDKHEEKDDDYYNSNDFNSAKESDEYKDYFIEDEDLKHDKDTEIKFVYDSDDLSDTVYEVLATYNPPVTQSETPSSTTLDQTQLFTGTTLSDIINDALHPTSSPSNRNAQVDLTTEQQTSPSTSAEQTTSSVEISQKTQGTKQSAPTSEENTTAANEEIISSTVLSNPKTTTKTLPDSNVLTSNTATPSVTSETSRLSVSGPEMTATTEVVPSTSVPPPSSSLSSSHSSAASSESTQSQSTTMSSSSTVLTTNLTSQRPPEFGNDTQYTTLNNEHNVTRNESEAIELYDMINTTYSAVGNGAKTNNSKASLDASSGNDTTPSPSSSTLLPSSTYTTTTDIPFLNTTTSSFINETANSTLINETISKSGETPSSSNSTFALHLSNSSDDSTTTYNETAYPLKTNTSDNSDIFSQTTTQAQPINSQFHHHILHLEQRIKSLETSMSKMLVNNGADAIDDIRSFVVNETVTLGGRLEKQKAEIQNQTELYTEERQKRDRDIQNIQNAVAKTSVMLSQLANQV